MCCPYFKDEGLPQSLLHQSMLNRVYNKEQLVHGQKGWETMESAIWFLFSKWKHFFSIEDCSNIAKPDIYLSSLFVSQQRAAVVG